MSNMRFFFKDMSISEIIDLSRPEPAIILRRYTFDETFDVTSNPTIPVVSIKHPKFGYLTFDRYKLHIKLSPWIGIESFYDITYDLNKVLDDAVKDAVITSYKLVFSSVYLASRYDERVKNFPYTLYLHNKPDMENLQKVAELCEKIEKILESYPAEDLSCMSEADLRVSSHVTFRQTASADKEEYIPADESPKELIAEAKESVVFKFLFAKLNPSVVYSSGEALEEKSPVGSGLRGSM